jgi:hypothetical protein
MSRLRNTGEITRTTSRTSHELVSAPAQVHGGWWMAPAPCKVPRASGILPTSGTPLGRELQDLVLSLFYRQCNVQSTGYGGWMGHGVVLLAGVAQGASVP